MRACFIQAAVFMLSAAALPAVEPVYFTAGTGRARSLAMGGAFTAVTDDFFASEGNPANLRDMKNGDEPRAVRCHLNPLLPAAIAYGYREPGDGLDGTAHGLFTAAGLVKGVSVRYHALQFRLSLFEESPLAALRQHQKQFLCTGGIYENHGNTVSMHFRLAPSISMGASGSLYYQEDEGERRYGGGISYGVLMQPSEKLNIGLVYFNFPDDFQFLRQTGDRLSDETINGGMSYRLTDRTMVALDLRNMTDDSNVGARELHLGLETEMFRSFALRGGIYGERATGNMVCSLGAGLARGGMLSHLPWWDHALDALDYSLVYETEPNRLWHALTFIYTI